VSVVKLFLVQIIENDMISEIQKIDHAGGITQHYRSRQKN
jgi:hypothetical protein